MTADDPDFAFNGKVIQQLYGRRIFQILPATTWFLASKPGAKLTVVVGKAEWADPTLRALLQNMLGPKALNVPPDGWHRLEVTSGVALAYLEAHPTPVVLVLGLQWISLGNNPLQTDSSVVYQIPDLATLNAQRDEKAAAWALMQQFKPLVTAG